ncbi:hypothetical protein ACJ8J4_08075 [Serratia sp. CY47280]|jgi:hypothetical protein|uniref:hypothetical protein n=1 Tax=Serratia sp. CY47280 TaxID=3383625 RepID=UPI003FA07494
MEKNKKPARSRLKECRNYPRISDNEGNNENNDDSEVIIAAACGRRFGTMCLLSGSIVWLAFFLKDMYNYMIFYQLIYSLSLSALFCLSVMFCESSRVFTFGNLY